MSKSNLRTEKYPVPESVDGICALVREVLAGGKVKRIELDIDDANLRAMRWVDEDGLQEEEITWEGALRNVEVMKEYYSDGASSFQVIIDMMLLARNEGLFCVCWATGQGGTDRMRKWLEVDERGLPIRDLSSLVGLPLLTLKSLPEETLVLCCSKYPSADASEVTLAVKTTMEMKRDDSADRKNDGGSRNHSQEHPAGTRQLALTTGGLRRVAWSPPRAVGHEQPK